MNSSATSLAGDGSIFLDPEAAKALGMRLDGAEFARVRVLAAPLEPVSIG